MPSTEFVIRFGAVCALAVLLLGAINGKLAVPAKIHWDWPLIAAYTLLFLAIAVVDWRNGSIPFALALITTAIGAAIFDTAENLLAYREKASAVISSGKWICFHASLLLMAFLFLRVAAGLPRVTGGLLVAAAIAGIAGLFGTPPKSMMPAIYIMSLAFVCFAVTAVRDPRILLS